MTLVETISQTVKLAKPTDYRMPAEWEKHTATWLAWPHNRFHKYWGDRLSSVEQTFVQIIAGLYGSEQVNLLVVDEQMEKDVRRKIECARGNLEHVVFYHIPTHDVWTRDYGPVYVKHKKGTLAITQWTFNGWGKFHDLAYDTSIPARIAQVTRVQSYHGGLVLEGGSIEVNGSGTLLTTEQCLLNKNRNPYYTILQIEKTLRDYLGVEHIVWLPEGLTGDDTDGHIDNLARFVDKNTIVAPRTKDRRDKNFCILDRNKKILQECSPTGRPYCVIDLPTPGYIRADGQRKAASYANFYISNNAVLVPTFNQLSDDYALGILREIFEPKRNVIPIDSLALVASGGTIHCVTQQQPAEQ